MIVSWRNVWSLMSEPPTQATTVNGNASGPVQSGNFQGPVQTVTVVTPVQPPPDTATHGERIRYITLAMMNLQQMFTEDRNERLRRQAETDEQYLEAQKGRVWIWRGMAVLAIAVFLIGALMLYMFSRLGWLW